ncbi:protein kinase domain-containing protein [Thalassolituus sp. LLYu03]|uniref:protein kinase domain-containing protein n=1 Tax=Thalassolituus sp. LLYu03 TaxID=3421656 RepID=UPI003D284AC6
MVYGGYSSAGVKPVNEDAFAAYQPDTALADYKGIAVCVADGVSCSEQAQLASTTSVTHFLQDYYSTPDSWDVKTAISRVLSSLNAWLFHHGQQASARHNSLVTTLSSVIVKSNTAHIAHVGDSRIYRLRQGVLEPMTRDHLHRHGNGREYLSRALGMDTHLEVDYREEILAEGDLFLLTTDGVHGFLNDPDLLAVVQPLADAGVSQHQLEKGCKELVRRALEHGSNDNLSACLLLVRELPLPELDEARRSLTARVIPPVLKVGDKIDHYQITDILFAGTRSHVYKVQNRRDGKIYVLKAPSLNFSDDLVYLEGFVREQWAGSRLDHPNVLKIYPPAEQSPYLYHISEWLPGQSLRQWMLDNPQPTLTQVRHITEQIVHGLRALQRAGMVHRDLKPENVMLLADGGLKLIDLGTVLVRGLAEINSAVTEDIPQGSVNYVAPETVLHNRATVQSDQFSLAVMVYEMLAGGQPYQMDQVHRRGARSIQQWKYRSLCERRPDIPVWFDLAVKKACDPDLSKRYEAYSEFLHDLHTPNPALLRQQQQRPLMERHPVRFWQGVSALLLLMVLIEALLLTHTL